MFIKLFVWTFFFFCGVNCFIIPEELPSILSIIYSNLPPIKKGTDSRVGLGFRLGPHADFQVLLELGPQNNTDPIGPDSDSVSKRQTEKKRETWSLSHGRPTSETSDKLSDTDGGKWIDLWRKTILGTGTKNYYAGDIEFTKVPGIDDIPEDPSSDKNNLVVNQLRRLYNNKPTKNIN